MALPNCILFDCMNTLIGVRNQDSYWIDLGRQGVEAGLFSNMEEFERDYLADLALRRQDPMNQEASLVERLLSLSCVTTELQTDENVNVAQAISENFAIQYLDCSYMLPGVDVMLEAWTNHAKIGVVSDFFTAGLPRRLLERHRLLDKIDHVIDSCEVGWRKPNHRIYAAALERLGHDASNASDILFIGDNPVCDVEGPLSFGMSALRYGCGDTDCDLWDWHSFTPETYSAQFSPQSR